MDFEDQTRAIDRKLFASLTAQKGESRSACFVVIAGKQTGAMYKLEKGEVLIGRGKEASIRIDDEGVSRLHAKIVRHPQGAVAIVDLRAPNGTFCNGERVTRMFSRMGQNPNRNDDHYQVQPPGFPRRGFPASSI